MTSKTSVVDSLIVSVCWQSGSEFFLMCWHEEPSSLHVTTCLICAHTHTCMYAHTNNNERLTWKPKEIGKLRGKGFFLQVAKTPYHHSYFFFWHVSPVPPSPLLPFSIQVQKLQWRLMDGTRQKSHRIYTVRYINHKLGCYFEIWFPFKKI